MIKLIKKLNLIKFITLLREKRRRERVYRAHLEVDYCRLKIQEDMRRLYPDNWN